MEKRKPIPKKIRFEVFKRDRFTCQYCGRMSPDVILEVDHIKPVAEGGEDEILNLITSCRDCNRGKGKTPLSDDTVVKKQQKQLIDLADLKEQSDMMIKWKSELLNMKNEQAEAINELIESLTGMSLNNLGKRDIKRLLSRFTFVEVYEATEIAFTRYFDDYASTDYQKDQNFGYALGKIGGICHNKRYQEKG